MLLLNLLFKSTLGKALLLSVNIDMEENFFKLIQSFLSQTRQKRYQSKADL